MNQQLPANHNVNPLNNLDSLKESITNPEQWKSKKTEDTDCATSQNLKKLLQTQQSLRELKSKDIRFSPPILMRDDAAVIFPNTINAIQGQTGAHKSRLAEVICSSMLKRISCDNELLGFKRRSLDTTHRLLYVDTERNTNDQLPAALQKIQLGAGYTIEDNPPQFDYISLLTIDREARFATLNEYFMRMRQETDAPIFAVLDVTSDCVEDFNKVDKSMQLIDMMGRAINEHNVTFLCILHENPRSDKMRGHLGTELSNKSSTVIQVAFEKDSRQNDTDLIKVKFVKCRSTRRHEPFYVKYSDEHRGLVLADFNEIKETLDTKKHKASTEELIEILELYMGDGSEMTRRDLIENLCNDLNIKQRTVENRLKELMSNGEKLTDNGEEYCHLVKEKREKQIFYRLERIDSQSMIA